MATVTGTTIVYTTGEAAKICGVSQNSIIRCFDKGHLTGFRVPFSKFRRIPRANLVEFMAAHGIPLDGLGALSEAEAAVVAAATARVVGPVKLTTAARFAPDAVPA
jgi:hypothetical protein